MGVANDDALDREEQQPHSTLFYTVFVVLSLLVGFIYVGKTWSPSSYAVVLKNIFKLQDTGLVVGKPRCIRSDEFAVITPLTQATVNNGFHRYNETSFYGEDLRMVYSLPVLDWGILFKPTMWLYAFANPAYAFSFHHYALIFLFLLGYTRLFNILGGSHVNSLLLSLILFWTGFTQYWWTALGPTLAFFPWLLISIDLRARFFSKLVLFYWFATCWILSFFYPPVIISLGFVGAVILFAFRPELLRIRPIVGFGLATLAALATAGFYLQDYLIATWGTVYPGQRVTMGGSVSFNLWVSQFFPTSQIKNHGSLIGANICEIGTVGTVYFLLTFCFLNYARHKEIASRSDRMRCLIVLGVGLLMIWAWMLFPFPSWVGTPLLWNRVQPERMLYAAGVLLLLIAFICAASLGLKLTWIRFAIFSAITTFGWYWYKQIIHHVAFSRSWRDVVVILPIAGCVLWARLIGERRANTAILVTSCIIGSLAFANFNPIQSAWPIFNRSETSISRMLDQLAGASPDRAIAIAIATSQKNSLGATLNGWGYRSIAHVLATPRLDIWRQKFPALSDAELNDLFNRYAHINLTTAEKPRLFGDDAITVPITAFAPAGKANVLRPAC
jgi:hypothetical protein